MTKICFKIQIVVTALILVLLLSYSDTLAFDKHRLSFSIGGDWSDCMLIRKQIFDPTGNPTTLMSINENIPGSIGFSGKISYKISKIASVDIHGIYSKTICNYNEKLNRVIFDDYIDWSDHLRNLKSEVMGSGFGLSYHSRLYNFKPVISLDFMIYRTVLNGSYSIVSNHSDKIDENAWGHWISLFGGISLNLSNRFCLIPFIGYRFSDTIKVYSHGNILYEFDYTSLRTGLYLSYNL